MLCTVSMHRNVLEAHRGRNGLCLGLPLYVPIRYTINGRLVVVDIATGVIVVHDVLSVEVVAMTTLATSVKDHIVTAFGWAFLSHVIPLRVPIKLAINNGAMLRKGLGLHGLTALCSQNRPRHMLGQE